MSFFLPGCEILQSFDLVHWEHVTYVYETLDHTDAQQLKSGQNIYGQGMWAASLRYHEGRFYICFVANDTRKTYLYTSEKIDGPWKKQLIEGFYHDGSLLFDEDGRNYIVYGNDEIWITELNEDLTAPKKDGLHRLLVSDHKNPELGYEGSHIQKINGYYYIFLIHSLRDRWMRTEACFYSDSLEGEFTGGDVLCDDRGYCGQGVAQGGIVDTPDGKWYAMLFQDSGAVGRIPILLPVTWKDFIFSMMFCNANCSITALQRTQTCDIALFQCRSINSNLSCAGRITHPLRKRIYCLCKLCTNFPCCNCIGSLQCIQMIVPWIWIMIKLPARKQPITEIITSH